MKPVALFLLLSTVWANGAPPELHLSARAAASYNRFNDKLHQILIDRKGPESFHAAKVLEDYLKDNRDCFQQLVTGLSFPQRKAQFLKRFDHWYESVSEDTKARLQAAFHTTSLKEDPESFKKKFQAWADNPRLITDDEIRVAIKFLGDAEYYAHEMGSMILELARRQARPALRSVARETDDEEIKGRAQAIVELEWVEDRLEKCVNHSTREMLDQFVSAIHPGEEAAGCATE